MLTESYITDNHYFLESFASSLYRSKTKVLKEVFIIKTIPGEGKVGFCLQQKWEDILTNGEVGGDSTGHRNVSGRKIKNLGDVVS